ncbi:MAG: CBS domain-containing protein [Chitinophagales bacterium]|nr:CBS domain-containing protein [Chitinophagales bacterium]
MIAKNAIEESTPYLRITDSVQFAVELMEEFKQEHLPVLNGKELVGVVSEQQLLDTVGVDLLSELSFPLIKIAVKEHTHLFDAMKAGFESRSSILPVVNSEDNYIGLISPRSLLIKLSEFNFARESGGIFVLEIPAHDYSLAEISRIVESNKASVLSIATTTIEGSAELQVTVKVNTLDLTYIIATLERYNYTISNIFHQAEQIDQLKDRYDALMHYLNV